MTDSDDSYELPTNVFTFQNGSTTMCAKGPNVNSTHISSWNHNMSTDLRQNYSRPRYAESAFDQRSMYSRRGTSPMSLCSASGLQARNYGPSHYFGHGISSQRSIYSNQRSRSPMSVRTNVSNVSAMEIVEAIVTNNFNREEWKCIKHAFLKKKKHRDRNRVRKRQNIRMFLKGTLNKSGGESGEQGSNSSISDDDCRSVRSYRTVGYTESKSSLRPTRDFRRIMQKSNMYRDSTDSLRQTTFKSVLSTAQGDEGSIQSRPQYNNSVTMQKDRFGTSFLLPSQRFNQSLASSTIPEKMKMNWLQQNNGDQRNMRNGNVFNKHRVQTNTNNNTDSEQEEIFSYKAYGNNSQSKKRGLDINDDICISDKKRTRLSKSPKINSKSRELVTKKTNNLSKGNEKSNDFVFPKPQFPLKRLGNLNNQVRGSSKLTQPSKKVDSRSQQQSKPSIDVLIPKDQQSAENVISLCSKNTKEANPKSQLKNPTSQHLATNSVSESNEGSNDAVFAKPQTPLKKSGNIKNQIKVTSKSTQPPKHLATKSSQQSTDIPNSNIQQPTESPITKLQTTKELNPKSDLKSKQQENCLLNSQQPKEKVISKSCQPLDATDYTTAILPQNDMTRDPNKLQSETTQLSTTDVSMRPSFIKRKLFTQKVDLTENKNSSSDNLDANSPHTNIYSIKQKEKSKTRKLVASQSCLNRDVFGDDSNLLDLIHKIVPADRMNLTTATNRSELQSNKSKPANADKWDISRVIATCNNDDGSDTFTDEEIFKADEVKETETKKKNVRKQNETVTKCAVVVERVELQSLPNKINELNSPEERNECNKRNLYKCVKSFWDTDSDSESNLESSNQLTNGKCNQKESYGKNTSNDNHTTEALNSKRRNKENTAPITNTALPSTKSTLNKTTVTVTRNNKKSENNPKTNKPATSKTAAIEKNNNTKAATLKKAKPTLNKATAKMQDNDKGSRGVKAAQKPNDNAINMSKSLPTEHTTVKTKIDKTLTQKCNTKSTLSNNLVLENVGDTLQKGNNTLSLRPLRKARIKLCCVQSSETEKSLNDISANESAVYRTLRSRVIDLSSSLSDNNTTLNKNEPNKNVRSKNNNSRRKVDNSQSDVSFTLTTDVTTQKRPSRLRNNIGKVLMMTRQNNVSCSLASHKSLDKTITKNNKKSAKAK